MFSQKKSFFKGKLFYVLLIGLFAFGYWVNQFPIGQSEPNGASPDSEQLIGNEESKEAKETKKNQENRISDYNILDNLVASGPDRLLEQSALEEEDDADNQDDKDALATKEVESEKEYYLVKSVDGVIQVFHYSEEGNESLVRKTDIAFSLLSVADQVLFQEGVMVHSKEELNELLQDFES